MKETKQHPSSPSPPEPTMNTSRQCDIKGSQKNPRRILSPTAYSLYRNLLKTQECSGPFEVLCQPSLVFWDLALRDPVL